MLAKLNNRWLIGIVIVIIVIVILLFNHKDTLFSHEDMNEIPSSLSDEDDEAHENSPENDNETESLEEDGLIVLDVKGEVKNPGIYEVENNVRVHHVVELAGGFTGEANEDFVNLAEKVYDEMIILVPKKGEGGEESTGSDVSSEKIRINYATQEEIEQLSGIGPEKAKAIINYRDEHGLFQSVEDLQDISGFGDKTVENISDDIQIP